MNLSPLPGAFVIFVIVNPGAHAPGYVSAAAARLSKRSLPPASLDRRCEILGQSLPAQELQVAEAKIEMALLGSNELLVGADR